MTAIASDVSEDTIAIRDAGAVILVILWYFVKKPGGIVFGRSRVCAVFGSDGSNDGGRS